MSNKAYFQWYETFYAVVEQLPLERQLPFMKIIQRYGLYGDEPEDLTPTEKMAWFFIKELIDEQKHKRQVNKENRAQREAKKAEQKTEPVAEPPRGEDSVAEPKQKTTRFVKPTVEEVKEYCKERDNGINPQQFVDYYETRGWKTKSGPIKDWKAAVRTWESRRMNEPPSYSVPANTHILPPDKLLL